MNPNVFREYDIRGLSDTDLTDDFTRDLGRAVGTHLARHGERRLVLGRDCRLSSPRLHDRFLEGLLQTGAEVIDVGVVPTPVLYVAAFHYDAPGGAQITGSHNPPEYNGFKVLRQKTTIFGPEIREVRGLMERGDYLRSPGGRVVDEDVIGAYVAHVAGGMRLGPRRFRIVVDAGNGTGGVTAVPILSQLGFEVRPLYCEMDGRFPNHHPDPTIEANFTDLRAAVRTDRAEVGLSLDGDADRLGVCDSRGRIVWGDQLMILFAREILKEVPGATFVSEVKASKTMYDDITAHGGRALMWKVGHSLIKSKMKEEHALLAGEMSGHLFFAHRYLGFDDAVYAAVRLCEMLSLADQTLAEHVDTLPRTFNTPEIRVEVPEEVKFDLVRRATGYFRARHEIVDVDGVRVLFPDGWGLIRASNTQPVLVLRFEAATKERLAEIRGYIEARLRELEADMERERAATSA
ncbi:MAG: phosphomannomutase/phosphoglucomutase [Deltaproteobacteria bacterium]|nr:phosphomannomutase/phosphoglucomutase [Deltaproteobacteria bacterium]